MDSNNIMQSVENLVCRQVSDMMTKRRGVETVVAPRDVYEGKKNIPFARIVARSFVFDLLHNSFGFSYAVISQRSGIRTTSVMRNVRKCHDLMERDSFYQDVCESIGSELHKL